MAGENKEKPDCLRCRHYFVTWISGMPRGCKLYGFKSAAIPSVVVKKTSGLECQGYEKKPGKP